MALTVEDGSIVTGAESLCSVADADAYHSGRGNAAWAALATTALKEEALRRATDFMRQRYRGRWQGCIVQKGQPQDWPRYDVEVDGYDVSSSIVPTEVVNACAEYALRAASSTLYADQERAVKREKVDVLEVEYSEFSSQSVRYPAIDAMLSPFLNGGGAGGVTVVRT